MLPRHPQWSHAAGALKPASGRSPKISKSSNGMAWLFTKTFQMGPRNEDLRKAGPFHFEPLSMKCLPSGSVPCSVALDPPNVTPVLVAIMEEAATDEKGLVLSERRNSHPHQQHPLPCPLFWPVPTGPSANPLLLGTHPWQFRHCNGGGHWRPTESTTTSSTPQAARFTADIKS